MIDIYQFDNQRVAGTLSRMMPDYLLSLGTIDPAMCYFGIVEEEKTVGTAAVKLMGEVAELLWFAIDVSYREMFVGTKGFTSLLMELYDRGVKQVLCTLPVDTDPKLRALFDEFDSGYESLPQCTITVKAETAFSCKELQKPSSHSISLEACPVETLRSFEKRLEAKGNDMLPVNKVDYATDLSAVYMDGTEAKAVLLFNRSSSETVELAFMASLSENPMTIIDMLRFSAAALSGFPKGTLIRMNLLEEKMVALVKRLLNLTESDREEHAVLARLDLNWAGRIRRKVDAYIDVTEEMRIS